MGDMMEILTNGLYPATRHRVVIPEEEIIRKQPRQSFVFFINPEDDVLLRPIVNLEKPIPKKYEPKLNAWEFQNRIFNATYTTLSNND